MRPRRPPGRIARENPGGSGRGLVVLFCRVDRTLKTALQRAALAAGKREAELVRELLAAAVQAGSDGDDRVSDERRSVLARLEGLSARLDDVGISTRAAVRLLAHWAAQSGAVRASEDELLAELRSVGRDEWQQVIEEPAASERDSSADPVGPVGRVLE